MTKTVKPFTGRAGTIKYDTVGRPEQTITKTGKLVDTYKPPKTAGAQLGNKKAIAAAKPANRAPAGFKAKMNKATPEKMVEGGKNGQGVRTTVKK
jgi:hypothetical protein